MCGICGVVAKDADKNIQKMTDALSHRGPNSQGVFIAKNIALGHRRLSIQDLSVNGHQPMLSADDRYVLVFNGEIYNHWEIRKNLSQKYEFKSKSDTETLLYGYIEYGVDIFDMLNGIFALSIYDKLTSELIIARDNFGVKPLYYYLDNKSMLFASEIKSIIQNQDINNDINESALANYLYFLWSPGEVTPLLNCKKLLPGHYIRINCEDLSSFEIIKYYEIPFDGKYTQKSENELIDELDERLNRAISRQLLSDVPVGFFLSGGLDSSIIVAMAKKANPNLKTKCYTIDTATNSKREGFTEDLPYAKKVAKYLDVELEIVDADVSIMKDFDNMIYYLDEPQADSAPLNVSNICKKARQQGYYVLLGGTAGDDLFSGYRRHQFLFIDKKLRFIPMFLKKIIFKITEFLPFSISIFRRINKLFSPYNYTDRDKQKASLYGWIKEGRVRKLFKNKLESFSPNNYLVDQLQNISQENESLNKMLFWDMKFFLTDHNLNYTDKMSMAHGVEVRVPFLDKELVEFSTKLPIHLKMNGLTTKYLLKKVAERYLPKEIIYRSKSGFGAPVRDWIIDDLNDKINTELNEKRINDGGIFSFKEVNKLIKENKSGKIDVSYSIWSLLAISSWIKQFTSK